MQPAAAQRIVEAVEKWSSTTRNRFICSNGEIKCGIPKSGRFFYSFVRQSQERQELMSPNMLGLNPKNIAKISMLAASCWLVGLIGTFVNAWFIGAYLAAIFLASIWVGLRMDLRHAIAHIAIQYFPVVAVPVTFRIMYGVHLHEAAVIILPLWFVMLLGSAIGIQRNGQHSQRAQFGFAGSSIVLMLFAFGILGLTR